MSGDAPAVGRPSLARDHLANERSLLSTLRLSTSLVAVGLTAKHLGGALRDYYAQEGAGEAPGWLVLFDSSSHLAFACVAVGAAFLLWGAVHFALVSRALMTTDGDDPSRAIRRAIRRALFVTVGVFFVLAILVGILLAMTKPAHAQESLRGYKADALEVADSGSVFFTVDSADIHGRGKPSVELMSVQTFRTIVQSSGGADRSVVQSQLQLQAGGAFVVLDRIRVAALLPVQLRAAGEIAVVGVDTLSPPGSAITIADTRLGADVRLFGRKDGYGSLALGGQVFLPTGKPDEYTGDGSIRFAPRVLFGGVAGPFVYGAKGGMMVRTRDEAYGEGRIGTSAFGTFGFAYRSSAGRLTFGPELVGSTVVTGGAALGKRTTPLELIVGAHVDLAFGLKLAAAGGVGLTPAYGAPDYRGILGLEWTPPSRYAEPARGSEE